MNSNLNTYIESYLTELVQFSKKSLKKSYNFEHILNNDFDIINANLIDKTINQNNYNLFIQTILTERKRNYYFPVIISVAASLFFKNFCDDSTEYNIGDILYKDGLTFRIIDKTSEYYELKRIIQNGYSRTRIYKTEKIKKYIVTTSELTNRRYSAKFSNYKGLFKDLFNVDYFPSRFSYKSVIILEKKSFLDKLNHHYEFDFKKSIPFKWVKRNGINKNESEFIPIEPMIYLAQDYEVFQEYIADKIENLDSVIFIGKNKYEKHLTKIKRDLRIKKIPKAIFIGNTEIDNVKNLKKWRWTYPEVQILNNINKNETNIINVTSEKFEKCIKDFKDYIRIVESEYSIDLGLIIYFTRYLYSIVVNGVSSEFEKYLEFVERILKEKTESEIAENLYSINQEPENVINEAKKRINDIFKYLNCSKFINLIIKDNIDILIVPTRFKKAWIELTKTFIYLEKINPKICSLNEFMKEQSQYVESQNVYLLSLFGYNLKFYDLIRLLDKTSHKIHYILYSDEKELYEKEIRKIKYEQLTEYNSDDRTNLCGIDFPIKKGLDSIHQRIEDLYSDYSDFDRKYHYDYSEHILYQITFDNSEVEEIDGTRTVIVENEQEEPRKEQVFNLEINDKIRIYENTDRKKLFALAKQEDNEGRLDVILSNSKLWKKSLLTYFQKTDNIFYTEENLLVELKSNGAKITLPTLKNWLDMDDDNLFPNRIENLKAIQKTIKSNEFDLALKDIIKSRRLYRSIMISLGHNLSDELNEYVISKKTIKGEFLQKFSENQIDSFLNHTAPLRTVKIIEMTNRGLDE